MRKNKTYAKIYFHNVFGLLFSCNKIENNKSLNQEDIKYIQNLNILDQNEVIIKFYSEFKKEFAGNFFTNKRVATYWIDKRNSEKNIIDFAFYPSISKIDTVYNAGVTYCPYALITKKDGSSFKISVEGDKQEIKSFFEDLLREWHKRR
ncbi:hypothetical protein ACQ9BO_10710 [Flavobacterium sp. P21]|uniref:hypothetical protein n=1 Tax=Flavobacterium sp. P21 TaxID=3423948 RepID=UPI003D67A805